MHAQHFDRISSLNIDQWKQEIEQLPETPVFMYRGGEIVTLRKYIRDRLVIEYKRKMKWKAKRHK